MPKIIENLHCDILEESIKIIENEGIEALSIRHLSKTLGIAPSTIYNYYSSKEQIIGALTKQRWDRALKKIDDQYSESTPVIETLSTMVEELRNSVKPLLMFHISAARDIPIGPNHTNTHVCDHQKTIFEQLQARVTTVIQSRENAYENVDVTASVITKLLIICMHDSELKFEDLANTIKKL